MAPIAHKRRREDDGKPRQPKKKLRVKRQKRYHSSSEDESDDDNARPTVSDAPVKRAVEAKHAPRSILKPALEQSKKDVSPPSEEDSDIEGGADMDETALNTAMNAAPAGDAEDEDNSDADLASDLGEDGASPAQDAPPSESDGDDEDSLSDTSTNPTTTTSSTRKKRNDPTAFSTSISRILGTKLSASKRSDPVLARSTSARAANEHLADARLEAGAQAQLKTEKRAALEKGRVRDVLGLRSEEVETGRVVEEEKRLKKVAQRGVVRLFNAVRAAQVRAERGEEVVKGEGVVGMGQRKERVGEMSKEGFLELISRGGGQNGQVAA